MGIMLWLVKICAALGALYVIVVAAMFFAQTWLIFPAFMVSDERPLLPAGAEHLEIATADGARLRGVRLPAHGDGGTKATVLGFAGNGWHAEGMALDLRRHFPDREITVFSYRGYPPSSGRPSAAALLADSLVIYDRLRVQAGSAGPIVVGYSLGSGVASYLARERSVSGLILVAPFDALEAVAQQRYPWVPVHWLIRHHMPSIDFLRGLATPTAVIAAERDVIVPSARTAALRPAIANLVLDRTIAGAQHHDIFHYAAFAQAMTDAITAIEAHPAP
jgi:predicted alpha/beta hydrolase family esterase